MYFRPLCLKYIFANGFSFFHSFHEFHLNSLPLRGQQKYSPDLPLTPMSEKCTILRPDPAQSLLLSLSTSLFASSFFLPGQSTSSRASSFSISSSLIYVEQEHSITALQSSAYCGSLVGHFFEREFTSFAQNFVEKKESSCSGESFAMWPSCMKLEFHVLAFVSRYIQIGVGPQLNYMTTALSGNDLGAYGFTLPDGVSIVQFAMYAAIFASLSISSVMSILMHSSMFAISIYNLSTNCFLQHLKLIALACHRIWSAIIDNSDFFRRELFI